MSIIRFTSLNINTKFKENVTMYLSPILKNASDIILDTHLVEKPKALPPSKMHEFFTDSLPALLEQQTVSSKIAAKKEEASKVGEFVGQIFNYFG